jgi:broad specificity phosphatase PhoE
MWLVRHGESAGNVARDTAESNGWPVIEIAERDMDVPLSGLGDQQSRALGRWFGEMIDAARPSVVMTSPYLRAMQTTERILEGLRLAEPPVVVVDERLREKEFGMLDRLTRAGIEARFPDEAKLRAHVGKFYYRPPGGESWCDVILRLRSVLDQVQLLYHGERVLIVAHQVIVLGFRYLLEHMTEAQILEIDRAKDVANCGVTAYELDAGCDAKQGMALRLYNHVAPLEDAGAAVTDRPDPPVAAR